MQFIKICQNKDCNEQYFVKRKDRIETSKYCSAKCRMHSLGNSWKNKERSEENCKNLSIAKSGPNHPLFGKFGKDNPNFGRKNTEEFKRNMSMKIRNSITPEYRQKISKLTKLGMRNSEYFNSFEYRQKMNSDEHRNKLKASAKERVEKYGSPMLGKLHSKQTKNKISSSLKNKKHKPHTNETKNKLRIYALNRVLKNNQMLAIGKNENKLLDLQEQKDNCKILRQYHIKDLGYIVDGYCSENNTVYEVYEKFHNKNIEKVQKDLQRETEICNHLSSDFIIIWDK